VSDSNDCHACVAQHSGGLREPGLLDRHQIRFMAGVGQGVEKSADHTRRVRSRDYDAISRTHAASMAYVEARIHHCSDLDE